KDRFAAECERFAEREELPENADLLAVTWEYATTVAKSYESLAKGYDRAMYACLEAGQVEWAEGLWAERERVDDRALPGRRRFTGGSNWQGCQYDAAGGATPYRFHVTELRGGRLKARIEQNTQTVGHSIFEVSGLLDGIRFDCGDIKPVQGDVHLAQC